MNKILTEFFDLDRDVKETEEKLKNLYFWKRRKFVLQKIQPEFVLGILYDQYTKKLVLTYKGAAKNHKEARGDMKKLRHALKCHSLTYRIYGGYGTTAPKTYLVGEAIICGKPIKLEVNVPWIKPGCTVKTELHDERRSFRTYDVRCYC